MYYKRQDKTLLLISLDRTKEYKLDLNQYQIVSSLRIDDSETKLAVVGVDTSTGLYFDKLYLHDLINHSRTILWNKAPGDVIWLRNQNKLVFLGDKGICRITTDTKEVEELFNTRVNIQSICLNNRGDRLAFTIARGDDTCLGVYSFNTGKGQVFKTSCSNYCWFDDETILYQSSGLRLLNTNNGTTSNFMDMGKVTKLFKITEKDENWIVNPIVVNDRVYFIVIHADADGGLGSSYIFSVSRKVTDTEIHYQSHNIKNDIEYLDNGLFMISEYISGTQKIAKREYVGKKDPLILDGYRLIPPSSSPETVYMQIWQPTDPFKN